MKKQLLLIVTLLCTCSVFAQKINLFIEETKSAECFTDEQSGLVRATVADFITNNGRFSVVTEKSQSEYCIGLECIGNNIVKTTTDDGSVYYDAQISWSLSIAGTDTGEIFATKIFKPNALGIDLKSGNTPKKAFSNQMVKVSNDTRTFLKKEIEIQCTVQDWVIEKKKVQAIILTGGMNFGIEKFTTSLKGMKGDKALFYLEGQYGQNEELGTLRVLEVMPEFSKVKGSKKELETIKKAIDGGKEVKVKIVPVTIL